jgi:heme exporter protein A
MSHGSSGSPAISATGLRKDYGDRSILRGVDISVPWGRTAALFGPNGAGKTTLLRILAGLSRPDAGDTHIAGLRMRRSGGRARTLVGFAGHQTLLYNDLTCRENLVFYAKLYGVDRPASRIDDVLEQLNLADRADRRVRTLSHGMQKRLSVARAVLHEPAVLLLDEPESGLDVDSVVSLGNLLKDWSASGKSALLTTHSFEIGQAWADRVFILERGRLAEDRSFRRDALPGSGTSGRGPGAFDTL